MSLTAFFLVTLAAFAHAIWNLLAKRASRNQHFIWFTSISEAVLLLPLGIWSLADSWSRLNWLAASFLVATGILHLLYAESLLHGYRVADLSVVYPIARGTGPLLSFLGALFIVGEHASVISGTGALFVTFGILLLSGSTWNHERRWPGAFWGVATGITIAGYTLVDGYSVRVLLLSPILVEYAGNLFRVMVLSRRAWQERGSLVKGYRECWKEALGVALLTPIAYVLVLFAMRIAPISRVAPAREMSMIIGAYLGTRLLGEGHVARRLIASLLVATGVAALVYG